MLGPPHASPIKESRLTPTARRLAAVYARYAAFGHTEPTFRSKEFVKLIKEAGLETAMFNIKPPNRVDFVYTYACVHGPGGYRNNKSMSLEQFAYATKGMAYEMGVEQEYVLAALEGVEPLLHTMAQDQPPMPVSSRLLNDLRERASGEDQYVLEKLTTSPLVQGGVLATYASKMTARDAEQAALSMQAQRSTWGSGLRSPRVSETPEWAAYSSPDRRRVARRLMWPMGERWPDPNAAVDAKTVELS